MNRIDSWIHRRPRCASAGLAGNKAPQVDTPLGLGFPYSLFIPEHYEPGYKYPLVLWLHSDDSSELEVSRVMPELSIRNYVAFGLRGPRRSSKPGRFYRWALDETSIGLTEEIIFATCQSAIEDLSINPERIFLAGYGTGGTLAQTIGLRYPDKFAGVVSINGVFPSRPRLLNRWQAAKKLPILWMHGNESTHCGLDAACSMLEIAYPAALQVYPMQFCAGDELTTCMLASANRFMMQIVTDQPITLQTEAGKHQKNKV